jgi:Fur family ferric uptake transcriptional regulator
MVHAMSASPASSTSTTRTTEPLEVLRAYIVENGLKSSRQREVIAETFFKAGGHLRVEELLDRVRAIDSRIGQATVYRTMKLLTQCGLAEAHQFGDGHTVYEPVEEPEEHHDHLICTKCGAIVEFYSEKIEALQSDIARQHGYAVTSHKMELYGICPTCLEREKSRARRA